MTNDGFDQAISRSEVVVDRRIVALPRGYGDVAQGDFRAGLGYQAFTGEKQLRARTGPTHRPQCIPLASNCNHCCLTI